MMMYFTSVVEIGWHAGVEGPLESCGNVVMKSHEVKQLIKPHDLVTVEVAYQPTLMSASVA